MKMNLLTSRGPFPKDSSYKCQFYATVRAPSRLVFQVWAKYKDEAPDVSASNQNTEMPCKNKLKLTLLKYLCLKSTEKLAKDHEFLFSILNALSVGNEEYYPKCYKVNGAKGLQKPLL